MTQPAAASDLKARVARTLDSHAAELEALAREIFAAPELGFKEHRTARIVHDWFDRLGLKHQDGIALTGSRADLACGSAGPTVAILGEQALPTIRIVPAFCVIRKLPSGRNAIAHAPVRPPATVSTANGDDGFAGAGALVWPGNAGLGSWT